MNEGPSYRNPVGKSFQLLTYLVDHGREGVGVRELARVVGMTPATAHRTLSDLECLNLVRVDEAKRLYGLGPEFVRLATKFVLSTPYWRLAEPILRELTQSTDETSYLCMLDPKTLRCMFVATFPSAREIRHVVPLHEWLDLSHAASGLAIYAGAPSALVARAELFIQDREGAEARRQWHEEVEEARRVGCAVTVGRRVEGAISIASPVEWPVIPCSIGITAPASRVTETLRASICLEVTAATERLSALWRGQVGTGQSAEAAR